jgi:hypothetical protein
VGERREFEDSDGDDGEVMGGGVGDEPVTVARGLIALPRVSVEVDFESAPCSLRLRNS